jgi:hypothetical protein
MADDCGGDLAFDWRTLRTCRCNLLITGPRDAVERSLAALRPSFDAPVCCWTMDMALPPPDVRTLVIRDVDELSAFQQRELACRLEESAGTMRLVSTTTVRLFELVTAGVFFDELYYRLNTWLMDASRQYAHDEAVEPTAIACRAFRLYLERGCRHGHDVDDWLQAERELRQALTSAQADDKSEPLTSG